MEAALILVLMMSLLQVAHGFFLEAVNRLYWEYLLFFGIKILDIYFLPQNFFASFSDRLEERSLVTDDGLTRWFLEHQPVGGVKNGAALVIFLHGGPGDMYEPFRWPPTRRWLELSDQHGFLLLTPNGTLEGWFGTIATRGLGFWNDLKKTLPGAPVWMENKQDDVTFLSQVIAWATGERNVDPNKVYISGFSNGGMMTYRMLIERSDIVSAGAAFSANLPGEEVAFEPPKYPRPLFIMHGSEDPTYEGGTPTDANPYLTPMRSATATRDYFVNVNGAGPSTEEMTLPDLDPNDSCRITSQLFPSTAPVQYYEMQGGGHFISTRIENDSTEPRCNDAYGVDLAWDFLSQLSQ